MTVPRASAGPPADLHCDVAIVGGGLAGLTAAWQLAEAGRSVRLFEARGRFGGRVATVSAMPRERSQAWLDVGPTWFWPHQQHMQALVSHFALDVFAQHTDGLATFDQGHGRAPQRFDASGQLGQSWRLVGGMHSLTNALVMAARAARVPAELRDHAFVQTTHRTGDAVVLAGVQANGHAMKCVVTYDTPFWRQTGYSGYAVSWTGPLQEIHDACMPESSQAPATHAIMGFVAPRTTPAHDAFRRTTVGERRDAVLSQLARLFGPAALAARDYVECDWSAEALSCGPDDDRPPAEHPAYGAAAFDTLAWNGRLAWAGAETSRSEGGYLDGAIASGLRAARLLTAD